MENSKNLMPDQVTGVLGDDEIQKMLSAVFGEGANNVELQGLVAAAAKLRRVSANYVSNLASRAFATAEKRRSEKRRKVFVVSSILTVDEQRGLIADWSGFRTLKFKPKGLRQCHGVAAATRKLETDKLVETVLARGYSEIKLVGENAMYAVQHFPNVVGICAPQEGLRDALTRNTRITPGQLGVMFRRGLVDEKTVKILETPGFVSRVKVEEDKRTADCLVARQVYLSKVAAAQGCDAARAREFIWTVVLPTDLMTKIHTEDGKAVELKSIRGHYRFRTEGGRRKVAFDYGDFCQGYVHDLEEYIQLTQRSIVETPHAVYAFDKISQHGDVAVLSLSVIPESALGRTLPRQVEVAMGPRQFLVKTWRYVSGHSRTSEEAFQPLNILVEADVFNRVVNMFVTMQSKDTTLQEGVRLLRALNSSAFVHGTEVGPTQGVRSVDLFPLAAAAALRALYIRQVGEKRLSDVMNEIKKIRSLENALFSLPFTMLMEGMTTAWHVFSNSEFIKSLWESMGLTSVFGLWSGLFFSNSRKPVQIEVVESVRWLDDETTGSLSSTMTVETYTKTDRKYQHERLRTSYLVKTETQAPELTLSERDLLRRCDKEPPKQLTDSELMIRHMNLSVREAQKVNDKEIANVEATTVRVQELVFPIPGVISETEVDRTWGGSTAKPLEAIGICARNGVVARIAPAGVVIDHMFIAKRGCTGFPSYVSLREKLSLGDELPDGDYVTWSGLKISTSYGKKKAFEDFVPITDIKEMNVRALTGVFGGGKTFELMKWVEKDTLLLASTRRGKTELSEESKKKPEEKRPEDRQVRTFDSYLMMPEKLETSRVGLDECYQQPFGVIVLALAYASGNRGKVSVDCFASGDVVQVGYINRTPILLGHSEIPDKFFTGRVVLTETRRGAADVVIANRDDYKRITDMAITTSSKVKRSMRVENWQGVDRLPRFTDPENQQYITMTHLEQIELVNGLRQSGLRVGYTADVERGVVGVNVPGEIQGRTVRESVIVRSRDTAHLAYATPGPILVATTRHTHSCVYYTVASGSLQDVMLQKFRKAEGVGEETLEEVYRENVDFTQHCEGKCEKCGYGE